MTSLLILATQAMEASGKPLSENEKQVVMAAQNGSEANCLPTDGKSESDEDPSQYESWDTSRRIRSDLLWWMTRNAEAKSLVSPMGFAIIGAEIHGALGLSYQTVPFPLRFRQCAFPTGIHMMLAELRLLSLENCWTPSIFGEQVTLESHLSLTDGFTCNGEVRLTGARIGGNLDCSGARLTNTFAPALTAERIHIAGSALFSKKFVAQGVVRLTQASILGHLDCSGGHFNNPDRVCFHADSTQIKGSVFFSNSTALDGLAQILGAERSSDAAVIEAVTATAEPGPRRRGTDDSDLTRFRTEGLVSLNGITVGGDIECYSALLENPGRTALSIENATVHGRGVFCGRADQPFLANGEVSLKGSRFGRDVTVEHAEFYGKAGPKKPPPSGDTESTSNPSVPSEAYRGMALNAEDVELSGSLSCNNALFFAQVRLVGAKIRQQLSLNGIYLHPGNDAITANGVQVGGSVITGFGGGGGMITMTALPRVNGLMRFVGAQIGGDFLLRVAFQDDERPCGLIAQAASIEGRFSFGECWVTKATILDLFHTRARTVVLGNRDDWPEKAKINFRGLTYDTIEWKGEVAVPLKWLRNQEQFSPQPYQQLAKTVKAAGNDREARTILLEKEKARHRSGTLSGGGRLWSWILDCTIGYGYKPQRALYLALLVVLVGAVGVYLGDQCGVMKKTRPEAEGYAPLNPLLYSLDVFLPLVNLRQKDHWWPDATTPSSVYPLGVHLTVPLGCILRIFLWVHILLGWILSTLFAAGLSGLVRKE